MNKKIKLFESIIERKWLFSIIINVILLAFYAIFYQMNFETNDDNGLSRIIAGFGGENEPHMIFVNYILGLFLNFLYHLNQSVPWYELFQFFICFCSLVTITYFLLKRTKSNCSVFLILSLDLYVAYELYVKTQFTKTAGIASTAGLIIILLFTLFEEKSILGIFFGVLLSLIGFCYRADMFFVCLFICSSIGLYYLLSRKDFDKKYYFKRLFSCIISLVILFCSVGVVYFVDKQAYSSQSWKEYYEKYNSLSIIYDYNYLNFDDEKLKNNGVELDDVDYNMLKRWNFQDPEVFSNDNLKKMSASLQNPDKSFVDFAKQMVGVLVINHYIPFLLFLFFLVLFLFFFIRQKTKSKYYKHIAVCIYVIGVILTLYLYMYLKGRIFVNRVDCIIWFSAAIPIIMMIENKLNTKISLSIFAILLVLSQILHCADYSFIKTDNQIKTDNREVFSVINNDKEHLYLSTTFGVSFSKAYEIFDDIPLAGGENFTYLGGWTSYAPFETQKLTKYNIENPFRDIIDNDSVYLIDEDIDNTIEYIQKHYNCNAKAIVVKEINSHKIYRIES